MAASLESMLLDSSSDDSDDEVLDKVTTDTTVPVASVVAALVQQTPVSPPASSAPGSNMSQTELSSRLKSHYSPAPVSTDDPFEPIPLHVIIQRQQAKAAASTPGPPIVSSSMPPPATSNSMATISRPPHISSSPSASSSTATVRMFNTVPTSSSALSAQASANSKREAKQREKSFLLFARVLLKYLEHKDPEILVRVKAVICECAKANKNMEAVIFSIQTRLPATVGEVHWRKAEEYLDRFIEVKKEREEAGRQVAQQQAVSTSHLPSSQQHQQHQAPWHPQLDQEKPDRDREEKPKRQRLR